MRHNQPLLITDQALGQVPQCLVGSTKSAVGPLLVPAALTLISQSQKLLLALDGLLVQPKRLKAVAKVAQAPALVKREARAGELLKQRQLLLKVAGGVLKVAHVEARDAQVAKDLGFHGSVSQVFGTFKLFFIALHCVGVVAQSHVNCAQVPVCFALAFDVVELLPHSEFLKQI